MIESVRNMKRGEVKKLVDARIEEFRKIGKKSSDTLFKELCFCILAANFNADKSMKIQEEIDDGFLTLTEDQLAIKLKNLGHRYPYMRAKYIVEARKYKNSLKQIVESFKDGNRLREWLVKNVRGIGYKEASHFLRNIGYTDLAIIDYHIVNLLVKHGLIERPRTLTRRRYMEIEKLLRGIAKRLGLTLAELDLYLWYVETGKILK